tara:strand:+ start:993 stop:1223 length:231 start_codon:yes stop_codon:yes gene_type:complete
MTEIIKAHQKIKTNDFNTEFSKNYDDNYESNYYDQLWDVLDMVNKSKGGLNRQSEILNRYDYDIQISVTYIKKEQE